MNNTSEMLTLLLDGELDPRREPEVFSELSQNEELRAEFHDLLRFKEAAGKDTEAFALPIGATAAVFGRLGFEAALKTGAALTLGTVFRKLWMPFVGAAVGAVVTFFLTSGLHEQSGSEVQYSDSAVPVASSSVETTSDNSARNTASAQTVKTVYVKVPGKTVIKEVPVENIAAVPAPIVNNAEVNPIRSIKEPVKEVQAERIVQTPGSSGIVKLPQVEPVMPAMPPSGDGKSNFLLSIRGMNSGSGSAQNDVSNKNSAFSNVALGMFYEFSPNHSFGIEVGQEPFSQVTTSYDRDYALKSESSPVLFWVGFSYRGTMDKVSFLGDVQPFGQFGIGSSQAGPVVKSTLGLQYSTLTGFGIMLGFEGSMLFYGNQNENLTTKKWGITYGLQYKF